MAIDASIYGRFAQPPRSALEYAQGFTQLGALQDQRRDNALTRAFRQREAQAADAQAQQQNALQQFIAQQAQAGRSDQEIIQAVRGRGDVAAAAQMETSYLDRQLKQADIGSKQATGRKSAADAAKTETEAATAAMDQYQRMLGLVKTAPAARVWMDAQINDPRLAPIFKTIPPERRAEMFAIPEDPQALDQWIGEQVMGMKGYRDWMASRQPKPAAPPASVAEYQFAKGEGYGGTYEQWVKDKARAGAASTSVNFGAPIPAVNPQTGKVELVRPDNRGGMTFTGITPPGDSEKPLSEGQAKAVAFASRMLSSDKTLAELARKGASTTLPGATRNSAVGDVVTALSPPEQQQLVQAKRDFVNAVLRRESGAVISPDEFANAERQYFPQIGDSRQVIEQKARNRRTAIEGMRADIPESRQGEVDRISGGGQPDRSADPLGLRGE